MKILLLVCLVGVLFLGASAVYAQSNLNLMGFSVDPLSPDPCIVGPGNQVYIAHLFISRPVNEDFEGGLVQDVAWVNGFECRVWIEGDAFLLGWHYPVAVVDAGTNGNTVVGFGEPVQVIDQFVVVATVEIFLAYPTGQPSGDSGELKLSPPPCGDPTAYLYMAPCRPYASVEGMMAFLDADDPDNPLVGATLYGSLQGDDLAMQMEVVPVAIESQAWGGVKALYR